MKLSEHVTHFSLVLGYVLAATFNRSKLIKYFAVLGVAGILGYITFIRGVSPLPYQTFVLDYAVELSHGSAITVVAAVAIIGSFYSSKSIRNQIRMLRSHPISSNSLFLAYQFSALIIVFLFQFSIAVGLFYYESGNFGEEIRIYHPYLFFEMLPQIVASSLLTALLICSILTPMSILFRSSTASYGINMMVALAWLQSSGTLGGILADFPLALVGTAALIRSMLVYLCGLGNIDPTVIESNLRYPFTPEIFTFQLLLVGAIIIVLLIVSLRIFAIKSKTW